MLKTIFRYTRASPTTAIEQVRRYPRRMGDALTDQAKHESKAMAEWAKKNHPWTNRTKLAETRLHGYHKPLRTPAFGGDNIVYAAGVSHGQEVWYAKYLEDPQYRTSIYGVIQLTIEAHLALVRDGFMRALNMVLP